MKLKEAQQIVNYILEWQFVLMGVKEREDVKEKIDLSKYSLNDLIKANAMVEANNKRKMKIIAYHKQKGHKTNGYKVSMILADRLIAAVYTAMSFSPNGEMIALIDGNGVGVVKAKFS